MPEPDEFQAYVLARRRSLLRTAWLLTGDWHAAEDLVQTALMRCYPKWRRISEGSVDDYGGADAYVRRAIINAHVSSWRRLWRRERPTAELPERASGTDQYAAADQRDLLVTALRRLPARQRAVVVLRFYEDLTEAQTAEILGCSVGTVKSQVSKALAKLRADGVLLAAEDEVRHA